jgi:hypothetical protein
MKPKHTLRHFLALAGTSLLAVSSAYSAAVIYEPFAFVSPDTTLAGNTGGTGLSNGTWTAPLNTTAEASNLTYGSLITSGSAVVARGYNTDSPRIGVNATALSGLLNDSGEMWMSFLYRTGTNAASGSRFAISLGDSYMSSNGSLLNEDADAGTAEQAIGFALPFGGGRGGIPMIWDTNTYDGGNINGNATLTTTTAPGLIGTSVAGFTPASETTYLFVLHAQWGADGATNDTVTLYAPGIDLALGSAVATYQAIVSQASFDTLSFTGDQSVGTLDEIRVGASFADVSPAIPEPSTALLGGLGLFALFRRRR